MTKVDVLNQRFYAFPSWKYQYLAVVGRFPANLSQFKGILAMLRIFHRVNDKYN